jgi:hypothetical protein
MPEQASSVLCSRPRSLSVEIIPNPTIEALVVVKSEDAEVEIQQDVPLVTKVQARNAGSEKTTPHHKEHQPSASMVSNARTSSASNGKSLSDQRRQSNITTSYDNSSISATLTNAPTALWIEFPNRKVLKMDLPWTLKYLSLIPVSGLFKEFSQRTAIDASEFDTLELKAMFSDKQSVMINRELPDEEFVDALDFCEIWMDDAVRARERKTGFKFLIRIPRAEHADIE